MPGIQIAISGCQSSQAIAEPAVLHGESPFTASWNDHERIASAKTETPLLSVQPTDITAGILVIDSAAGLVLSEDAKATGGS